MQLAWTHVQAADTVGGDELAVLTVLATLTVRDADGERR